MLLQIAFYTPINTLFEKGVDLIQRFQGSENHNLTHCELIVDGMWYSSSYKDGGVRKRDITGMSGNWTFLDIHISLVKYEELKIFLEGELGKDYDIIALLLSQIFPLHRENHNDWFCSELLAQGLINIEVLNYPKGKNKHKVPSWYSPARLYDELLSKGLTKNNIRLHTP